MSWGVETVPCPPGSPASDGGGVWVAQVVTYVVRLLHWQMLEESIKVSSLYFNWICCWKTAWCSQLRRTLEVYITVWRRRWKLGNHNDDRNQSGLCVFIVSGQIFKSTLHHRSHRVVTHQENASVTKQLIEDHFNIELFPPILCSLL